MTANAVELKNVTKTFGQVVANENIHLTLRKGEILALLGENGSGKTTLVNMLSGIYYPDKGQIFINGKEASIRSPHDAFEFGIGMIHQHFKLVDVLTAAENIVLGLKGSAILSRRKLNKQIKDISLKYGFELDPEKKIYNMSVSEKQTVEIIKVLYRGADILILDEPTAVLTPQETDKLFAILKKMKEDGKSIIIITHKLSEVMSVSDRVTIVRKGQYIDTIDTKDANVQILTDMMVGKSVSLKIDREKLEGKTRLKVNSMTCIDAENVKKLDKVSFELKSGEILGIAGIAGSGQKELCEALAGLQHVIEGNITYVNDDNSEDDLTNQSPRRIIEKGVSLAFVPEDRLGMGLVANLDMADNMMLKTYNNQKKLFIDRKTPHKLAEKLIKQLDIVTPGVETPVCRLSGGNVQKVLLGREIECAPSVLLVSYPVRGLDINSSYLIYDLLNDQKKKGVAIMYVGEDLDVLLELCDRILVLCGGKITGIVDAATTTKEAIGMMMINNKEANDGE